MGRRGEHRKTFFGLYDIVKKSYPVGYEFVDERHSRKDVHIRGQFIYASLAKIFDKDGIQKTFCVSLKFDDTSVDSRARFKNVSVKNAEDHSSMVFPLTNSAMNEPSSAKSSADAITVQQLIDFVKSDFEKKSNFSAFDNKKDQCQDLLEREYFFPHIAILYSHGGIQFAFWVFLLLYSLGFFNQFCGGVVGDKGNE